ncbi:hypothetical protein BURK_007686 [Burkholderia sp. SJ98]|nr:hypothetical protein BURK_007686 [Burkholderia sp. SJ98]
MHADGAVELSGLGKLAGGGLRGNYSKKDTRLLADGPDANRAEEVMALLAYHCRRVKGLTNSEREKADQQFYEVVKALSAAGPLSKRETSRASKSAPAAQQQNAPPVIAPSVRQAASLLKVAAHGYKSAMGLPFMAALGGSYIPVVPYELLENETMLEMVASQKLMEPVPNLRTVPEYDTESLAYGICRGIRDGDAQVADVMTHYGSKIPERLYADIGAVRDTMIYTYFKGPAVSDHCDVFLGLIRNRMDEKAGKKIRPGQLVANWPIPVRTPSFSAGAFAQYVAAVKTLDRDATSLLGTENGYPAARNTK